MTRLADYPFSERPCPSALKWLGDRSASQAWAECPKGSWLTWWLDRVNYPRTEALAAAWRARDEAVDAALRAQDEAVEAAERAHDEALDAAECAFADALRKAVRLDDVLASMTGIDHNDGL